MSLNSKRIFSMFYISAILLLITLPINDRKSSINNTYILNLRSDFILHALLFVPWMFLKPNENIKIKMELWAIAGFLFSITIESIQYFIPYRTFNLNDLIANCIGIGCSMVIYTLIKK